MILPKAKRKNTTAVNYSIFVCETYKTCILQGKETIAYNYLLYREHASAYFVFCHMAWADRIRSGFPVTWRDNQ